MHRFEEEDDEDDNDKLKGVLQFDCANCRHTSVSRLLPLWMIVVHWYPVYPVLPVNLLVHPVLIASGSHYTGYQLDNVLFTKLL